MGFALSFYIIMLVQSKNQKKYVDSYLMFWDLHVKLKVHINIGILETQDKIYLLCLDIEADINGPCSKKQYNK